MKILFWGDTRENAGPMNINKGIVKNLSARFRYVPAQGKYRKMAMGLLYLMTSDALVVSGISKQGGILVAAAKLLRRPSVYIMHGCAVYENRLNNRHHTEKSEKLEAYILENAKLILPVSKKFMHWVHQYYPQYSHKTEYLFNGIDQSVFDKAVSAPKQPGSVVAMGGLRIEKNNIPVIEAVEKLDGRAVLSVFGVPQNGEMPVKQYSHFVPKVSQPEFLSILAQSQLFVLNSIYETFGISVTEALACGCSVLISEIVGSTDLFALEETDIIHDPMDTEEIRRKIEYLLEHPNNERILSTFNIDEWSFAKMVERLEKRCANLIHH